MAFPLKHLQFVAFDWLAPGKKWQTAEQYHQVRSACLPVSGLFA